MANDKVSGASGKITLLYKWQESSSGHREDENEVILRGSSGGKSVDLVLRTKVTRYLGGGNDESEEKYRISVTKLIDVIKANGKRL